MAKRVIWTGIAKKERKSILAYWIAHNKSSVYSKKISILLKRKTELLKSQNYIGKPTDFYSIRTTLVLHFSIFYKITQSQIIIVGIWDNRRNPEELQKNIEL